VIDNRQSVKFIEHILRVEPGGGSFINHPDRRVIALMGKVSELAMDNRI
jgi:methyl coenzyme M reductase subunit D